MILLEAVVVLVDTQEMVDMVVDGLHKTTDQATVSKVLAVEAVAVVKVVTTVLMVLLLLEEVQVYWEKVVMDLVVLVVDQVEAVDQVVLLVATTQQQVDPLTLVVTGVEEVEVNPMMEEILQDVMVEVEQ